MPKVKCPKCGGEVECLHDDCVEGDGQLFDLFILECSNCGHKDSSGKFAGYVSSAGNVHRQRDNPCPFCQPDVATAEEQKEKKEEEGIEYPDEYPID